MEIGRTWSVSTISSMAILRCASCSICQLTGKLSEEAHGSEGHLGEQGSWLWPEGRRSVHRPPLR